MIFRTLMSPGCGLMRKMRLSAKVLLLALVLFTPLVFTLIQSALSGSGSGWALQVGLSGIGLLVGGYLLLAFYQSLTISVYPPRCNVRINHQHLPRLINHVGLNRLLRRSR